jgi:hypothetical protein
MAWCYSNGRRGVTTHDAAIHDATNCLGALVCKNNVFFFSFLLDSDTFKSLQGSSCVCVCVCERKKKKKKLALKPHLL